VSGWLKAPEVALMVSVNVPVTVCWTVLELLLAELWLSPEYLAVMA
jgi:hypothetical protein